MFAGLPSASYATVVDVLSEQLDAVQVCSACLSYFHVAINNPIALLRCDDVCVSTRRKSMPIDDALVLLQQRLRSRRLQMGEAEPAPSVTLK